MSIRIYVVTIDAPDRGPMKADALESILERALPPDVSYDVQQVH